MENQPSLSAILTIPTSDQLDDWRDYLHFLVDNYGPEAAGPCIADISGEALTPRMRQQSLDSGYHSSEIVSGGKGVDPDPEHGRPATHQTRFASSAPALLGTQGDMDNGAEMDQDPSEGQQKDMVEGEPKNGREAKPLNMKLEPKGVMGVSEVVIGGEMGKKEKDRERKANGVGYFGLGKKWGF